MPDPYDDSEQDRRTDPRFDAWPLVRYDAWTNWPVDRETPGGETAESYESGTLWMGAHSAEADEKGDPDELAGGPSDRTPYLYDPDSRELIKGELDQNDERVVIPDDHERYELESEQSLGERLREIGEKHDWEWLSSFARKHLEEDAPPGTREVRLHATDFNERNIPENAPQDFDFVASHTFIDEDEQVYTIEREFDVFVDESDGAIAEVSEELLAAEGPHEEMQAGDAERMGERDFELPLDVDPNSQMVAGEIERKLKEWHRNHVAPGIDPTDAEGTDAGAVPDR